MQPRLYSNHDDDKPENGDVAMASPKDSIKQSEGDNNENGWENKSSGNKQSSWFANLEQPMEIAKLTDNISSSEKAVEVVIVGGGIAGVQP
jgi:hypothetical protein